MGKRRILAAGAVAALAATLGFFSTPVTAQDADVVDVPLGSAFIQGAEGDTVALGSADVDAGLVGRACNVVATVVNQGSVHAGNKLVVSSGDSSVEIAGIEDTADATTSNGGALTLGESISASIVLGADGMSSIASSMKVTCEPVPEAEPTDPAPATPTYTG